MSSAFTEFAPTILKMRRGGSKWVDIAAELRSQGFEDVNPEAIRGWHRRQAVTSAPKLIDTPARQRKAQVSAEDYEALAPIIMAAPPPPKTTQTATNRAIVGGDLHFGVDSHSPECEEIFLDVVKDARPKVTVLNGDLPDMMALSRYPTDARLRIDLGVERKQMFNFLYRLHEIVAPWGGKIVETNANHSGEAQESRWWRYLSERIPELVRDPVFAPEFTYKRWWHPEWANIDLVDYYTICPGLIAIHGDIVRPKAAYSARGMLEKWRHNLVHNHTHRMGRTGYRVPGIAGKAEHQMQAFENGCLCNLKPNYGPGIASDWQNGFSIFDHDEEGNFGVEQVLIHNNRAVVTTLGKTYRASE